MIAGLVPLLVIVALISLVWRAVQGRPSVPGQQAHSLRRLIAALLLFGLVVIVTVGLSTLLGELIVASVTVDYVRDTKAVAQSLAFVLVGAPLLVALARYSLVRLRDDDHRRSASWRLQVVLGTVVSVAGVMITWHQVLRRIGDGDGFEWRALGPAVAWTGAWVFEWVLQRRRPPGSGVHRLIAAAMGLVTMTVGLVGSLRSLVESTIYRDIVGSDGAPRSWRPWLATLAVGAAVWAWYWLAHCRHEARTPAWYALVLLGGGLGGLATAVTAASIGAYRVVIRWIGETPDVPSARYFRFVPATLATALVGLASWGYHRAELRRGGEPRRSEPVRAYAYLSAFAGLGAGAVGVVMLVMGVIEELVPETSTSVRSEPTNRLVAAVILVVVGGLVWASSWRGIQRWARTDPGAELHSVVRRVYVTGLFGAGATASIVGVLIVVTQVFEDGLDGVAGWHTLDDAAIGIGLVAAAAGITWYHLSVLRGERPTYAASMPQESRKHVVVVARDAASVAGALASRGVGRTEAWERDGGSAADVDLDRLAASIMSYPADRLLVLIGVGEPQIVGYHVS